jgi:hypothetical protein
MKNKYGNIKISRAGMSFASKLEAAVYNILCLRMKADEISSIQCQDTVYLTDARIIYKPDFKCTRPDGTVFWAEAKGFKTAEWVIKKRLWAHYGPGLLEIWEGSHAYPKLTETIIPKTKEGK